MMRECPPTELIDLATKFQQKARESIQAWFVGLCYTGDGDISLMSLGSRQKK